MTGEILGREFMLWFIRLLFVVGIALLIGFAVNEHGRRDINIKEIEGNLVLDRTFYSSDCFAYDDGVRTHIGTVDLKKFNDEVLAKCLKGVYKTKAELVGYGEQAYNDKEGYEQNHDFCKFENKYYCYSKDVYVIVNDNGALKGDILRLSFVVDFSNSDEVSYEKKG